MSHSVDRAENASGVEHNGAMVDDPDIIMAVVENRAKEIGLARIDLTTLSMGLLQFIETSRSYTVTLSVLEQFGPPAHLVVVNSSNTEVLLGVNYYTSGYHQVAVDRRHFDDTKGAALLALLARPSEESIRSSSTQDHGEGKPVAGGDLPAEAVADPKSYLAISAASALLNYLTCEVGHQVAPGALGLEQLQLGTHMYLDVQTVAALELIRSQRPPPGGNMKHACKSGSLYQLLNRTRTSCGARLLRASILQPLRDEPTITARLDAVQELVESADLSFGVGAWLKQTLPRDLDKMCIGLGVTGTSKGGVGANVTTSRRLSAMVQAIVSLRKLLEALPALAEALAPSAGALLTSIRALVEDRRFSEILGRIHEVIDEEAQAGSNTFMNHIQCCFAVKENVSQVLDLSREAFSGLTEQITNLAEEYKLNHNLPEMRTRYATRRGFSLIVPHIGSTQKNGLDQPGITEEELPGDFQVLERKQKQLVCTTQELNALNKRLRDVYCDCLRLTEQVAESLREELLRNMLSFRKLVDSVALLDMLLSFAEVATMSCASGKDYCKPRIYSTPVAPLVLVGARNALLEAQLHEEGGQECRANDTYLCETSSLAIITGPNMSGKSTYLRQVGLAVVMAQAGSFVPASFASLSPFARVFARAVHGSCSSVHEASGFLQEMTETAAILRGIIPRSLVLMDELGRATSTSDGVAISMSVAEALASAPAYTLFTTHFPAVAELAKVQPTSKLWHFEVSIENDALEFTWKMKPGANTMKEYGIKLAECSGFPPEVIGCAKDIAAVLHEPGDGDDAAYPQQRHVGGAYLRYDLPDLMAAAPAGHVPFRPPLSVQELRMQRRLLAVYHKLICIGLAASDSTMPPSEVRKQLEPLTDEASSVMKGWTWQPRQG